MMELFGTGVIVNGEEGEVVNTHGLNYLIKFFDINKGSVILSKDEVLECAEEYNRVNKI
ncbi:hypothetical protein [Clostridium sp. M14]|uniref:hypothetical protein n=1 Tax=Clostridium sp. M14 TaxID=2716311 RepID=UPI0013EEB556|nr:hypothetical protein [Clostridium sp. M14]MBZ9693347.1 hypothetical protein [Clostridium sp. M14]